MEPPVVASKAKRLKQNPLIQRLLSWNEEESRAAREAFLRQATDDPALFHANLADIVKAITGNRKRASVTVVGLILLLYPIYFTMLILLSVPQTSTLFMALLWTAAFLVPTGLLSVAAVGIITRRRSKRLVASITEIDDMNALPVLIELSEFTHPAVQSAIIPPITRLLLRLGDSDAPLLSFLHRTALTRSLSTPRARKLPISFFLAALKAFEHMEDSQALPTVAWLAHGKGIASDHPEVQAAAQACETHLQEILRRQQASHLLLRASSAPAAPDTLLRPVVSAPDLAHHELLRPNSASTQEEQIALGLPPQAAEPEILPLGLQRHADP